MDFLCLKRIDKERKEDMGLIKFWFKLQVKLQVQPNNLASINGEFITFLDRLKYMFTFSIPHALEKHIIMLF